MVDAVIAKPAPLDVDLIFVQDERECGSSIRPGAIPSHLPDVIVTAHLPYVHGGGPMMFSGGYENIASSGKLLHLVDQQLLMFDRKALEIALRTRAQGVFQPPLLSRIQSVISPASSKTILPGSISPKRTCAASTTAKTGRISMTPSSLADISTWDPCSM